MKKVITISVLFTVITILLLLKSEKEQSLNLEITENSSIPTTIVRTVKGECEKLEFMLCPKNGIYDDNGGLLSSGSYEKYKTRRLITEANMWKGKMYYTTTYCIQRD